MSSTLTSTLGAIEGAAAGIAALAGTLGGSPVDDWIDSLQTASWRGVPFAVTSSGIKPGRQTSVHLYPERESGAVWVEDLGIGPSPFSITGFLVAGDIQFGGVPLSVQQAAMIAACEAKGPGTLVYPSLGSRLVSLIGGCEMVERLGAVGVIELRFEFLQTAPGPQFPGGTSSTTSDVGDCADTADSAGCSDFAGDVGPAVQTGAEAVGSVASTVAYWAAQAQTLVGDAARAANAVSGLTGTAGRYTGFRSTLQPATATVGSLVAASTSGITAVGNAAVAVQILASAL